MARQNLNGSDSLNIAYQKSNENFIELYAGTGGGGGGASELSALEDVNITLPITQDQILAYNAIANEWENKDLYLDNVANVDFSEAPTNGQVLMYSAGIVKWTAQTLDFTPEIEEVRKRIKKNYIFNLMGV